MANNYDFLRTFTFDGKETNHLFQIAKVNIPFLTKENEFYTVGNTDSKKFSSTRLGDHSVTIDGFVIKDNTGKSVSDSMDELKLLINSDEPKKLIFDIFPDRYFNAIFSGTQEYDATNLEYTPLTLVFDVPDALAHSIHSKVDSNVYTTGTNLVLDSEYTKPKKYMAQWARVLTEKHEGSAVVNGDLSGGLPLDYKPKDQYYWVNNTEYTRRNIQTLTKGNSVSFSIMAKVIISDSDPNITKAGMLRAEMWQSNPLKLVKYVDINIPKNANSWQKYGVTLEAPTDTIDMINLAYCLNGKANISFSKPMMALLPPLGDTVVEPIAGATLYSNSLDWGDYDYSGNPNLAITKPDMFASGTGGSVTYTNGEYSVLMDGTARLSKYNTSMGGIYLAQGKTYTLSAEIFVGEDYTGNLDQIFINYAYLEGGYSLLQTSRLSASAPKGQWITVRGTSTVDYQGRLPRAFYFTWQTVANATNPTGTLKLRNIKIEQSSINTPYQPNLLQEPWQVSKVALNKNLITNNVPVSSSNYLIHTYFLDEFIKQGDSFTIRIKATKPSTKTFRLYMYKQDSQGGVIANENMGDMTQVEGLSDTWELKVPSYKWDDTDLSQKIRIYQAPNSDLGPVSITWGKVERGLVATPPIDFYKYRGLGTFPSNNPHDYSWSYDPSYYKAVTYIPSEEGIGDVLEVNNNGSYKVAPKFSFTMNGENGLVGLINENGGLLQFGNPQDVDGTTPTRQEWGLNEGFYGNTLNPNIKVNTGFKSVYPNMNSNPSTPNLFQGIWNMTTDIDTATPQFATAPSQAVWHGPSMVLPVQAPSDNDRTGNFRARVRFNFDNRSKRARGRTEVSVIDTSGNYVMGAVIRDSDTTSDSFVFESWYKDKMIKSQTITKNIFNKSFFELALYRTGKEILWKFTQIKSLNANSTVNDDKVIWVSWNLDEDDTSEIKEVGIWQMRYQGYEHVLMSVTDVQGIWSHTKYWQDIENTFQDGDIVEIDVNSRSLYINGTVNNTLNVVGNEWEKFYIEPGKTIIQPVVSTWANKPVVTAEFSESFL